MKRMTIGINDAGQRLDKFLKKSMPTLPTSLLYKFLRKKRIKVNGKRAEAAMLLQQGDELTLYIQDEFFDSETSDMQAWKKPYKLEIVYEDPHILILHKPQGLLVHPGDGEKKTDETLLDHAKRYLYQSGSFTPEKEHTFAPAVCNRLDRNTGGLVIVAKTAEALRTMNEKIKHREVQKDYLCLCLGKPAPSEGKLTDYLVRDRKAHQVSLQDEPQDKGKKAELTYRVLWSEGEISCLAIRLLTGRTHQIRAQLAKLGHPLLGDGKYGDAAVNRRYGCTMQQLLAYRLHFAWEDPVPCLVSLQGKTVELVRPAAFCQETWGEKNGEEKPRRNERKPDGKRKG